MIERDIEVPLIDVPYFVKVYCQNRTTEYIKYLNPIQLKKAFHNKDLQVKTLGAIDDLTRCLITQRVKPLTVLKNPMLMYAAELEYRTWRVDNPISLQEARWLLQDSYPETNCGVVYPTSSLILIKEHKGCCKLDLTEQSRIVAERKRLGLHGRGRKYAEVY